VGIYATSASTPLFFAQAIGRFVRSRRPGESASIFVPSVPSLLQLASELEAQRNHVLGQPHRDADDPLDADPAVRTQTEKSETDKGFTSLGADAELDQVIFDGSSFGTAAPAGSDEEADYLGIPGLPTRCAPCCTDARTSSSESGRCFTPRPRMRRLGYLGHSPCMASSASCAASSTPSSRRPTTAPANRTDGFTASFAVAAGARLSPRRPASSFKPASKPCGS